MAAQEQQDKQESQIKIDALCMGFVSFVPLGEV